MMGPHEIDLSKGFKSEGPICPFMSGQAVPTQAAGGLAVPGTVNIMTMMVPCARENCGIWNTDSRTCALNYIPKLSAAIEVADETAEAIKGSVNIFGKNLDMIAAAIAQFSLKFDPPKSGSTSIGSMADAAWELVTLAKAQKGKR